MYWCMRTNIVLNDELVAEAQRYSLAKSKSALVDEALRLLVEVRASEERRQTYEKRLLGVQQKLQKKPLRTSALDILREDRQRP